MSEKYNQAWNKAKRIRGSAATKQLIVRNARRGGNVVMIDPDRAYGDVVRQGG